MDLTTTNPATSPHPGSPQPGADQSLPPVVLTCDGAYAMALATTLRSLVDANPLSWPVAFHILYHRFSEEIKWAIVCSLPEGSACIRWVPIDPTRFQGLESWAQRTRMNYARLLIPQMFPETTSRVLYLDPDVIVLDDLRPLGNAELDGAVIGAVLDEGIDPLLQRGELRDQNVPEVHPYFNAGVLVIDLPRWRTERISERALEYLSANPKTRFSDQDGVNVACAGRWRRLDARWNHQRHLVEAIDEIELNRRPAIVHFVNGAKPWDPRSLSINATFYDGFRSRTHFARTPREQHRDAIVSGWTKLKRLIEHHVIGPVTWDSLRRSYHRWLQPEFGHR